MKTRFVQVRVYRKGVPLNRARVRRGREEAVMAAGVECLKVCSQPREVPVLQSISPLLLVLGILFEEHFDNTHRSVFRRRKRRNKTLLSNRSLRSAGEIFVTEVPMLFSCVS